LISAAGPEPITVERDDLPANAEVVFANHSAEALPVTLTLGLRRGSDGYVWPGPPGRRRA